ncbi:MAG: FAD-dependent oxidoreductase, partial [Planctomycetota bacterium]
METINHKFDFCVIGGGLSGMCAAIAAARHGIKTALVHDRPVLGGNASSEIRMWVCGAKDNKETGIIEELKLDNIYHNPGRHYPLWDAVLYGKVKYQENLEIFLNCSCADAEMDGDSIKSVKCWQLTTYTWHKIEADLFADCSGDSVLAPLTGAETRTGREASAEFDEDIEPEKADDKTMGMSLLMQPQEEKKANTFRPFPWANTYPDKDSINNRLFDTFNSEWQNFWWIELGGTRDTIKETENIRDDLLKVTLGVWDHIKNQVDYKGDKWGLNFMGFLPGKRESLRYVGDHMLCQNEVRAEGKFDDLIAYGG